MTKKIIAASCIVAFLVSCGCGKGTDSSRNYISGVKYEMFVLECNDKEIVLCSVDANSLLVNSIKVDAVSTYMNYVCDELGKAVSAVGASILVGGKFRDLSPSTPAGLSDSEVKACKAILKEGVILHAYKNRGDGTLGPLLEKREFRIAATKPVDTP